MQFDKINKKKYKDIFSQCIAFDDIYEITEDMTAKEKGDLFELITYFTFKLSPLLNKNVQNVWLYDDVPQKILKKLNLPSKDKGIDLVVEINNEYFAIQCKFRQNTQTVIKWGDLATFYGLSFGIANKIKGGFLFTNTDEMCNEVNKSSKVRVINSDFFKNILPEYFFCNICNLLDNAKIKEYVAKKPFVHQQNCINECIKYYNSNDDDNYTYKRGHIIMACGAGKSLTSYWVDKNLNNKITSIFVPSLYLLSQFAIDIINQSYAEKCNIQMLLIGSDNDVDDDIKHKIYGELKLETVPDKIYDIINDAIKNKIKLIIICTYQSSDKLAEACSKDDKDDIEIDFGIFDEAHKTVGQTNRQFSLMLDDANLIINKRLFMTATPKMYCGKIKDDDNDNNILSMNDETQYGKEIYCYNTGDAIKDKKLVDYDVISLVCTNKDMETMIKSNKLISYKKEFSYEESNYLGTILILLKKMHDGSANHLLTYHNTINRAKKFAEFLEKINKIVYEDDSICVNHFDGSTGMSKRNKIIKDFTRNKKAILCTARVLNEGVNIPVIDSECFVDERKSTIDIVQCVGRALRTYEGKTMAHIFIPTFIENFDDAELDEKNYGNTIRILKAMKSTDGGITEYFKLKHDGKKIKGRQIVKFEYAGKINASKEISMNEWSKSIGEKIWQVVDTFEYKKELLFDFVNEYKRVPTKREQYNDIRIGLWLHARKKKIQCVEDKMYKILSVNKIIRGNYISTLKTKN
jgi:predicted helicase